MAIIEKNALNRNNFKITKVEQIRYSIMVEEVTRSILKESSDLKVKRVSINNKELELVLCDN